MKALCSRRGAPVGRAGCPVEPFSGKGSREGPVLRPWCSRQPSRVSSPAVLGPARRGRGPAPLFCARLGPVAGSGPAAASAGPALRPVWPPVPSVGPRRGRCSARPVCPCPALRLAWTSGPSAGPRRAGCSGRPACLPASCLPCALPLPALCEPSAWPLCALSLC